ncbi:uncharacterized protein FOMMEDRAFT_159176 [Fomitiporia mediterranea MF3/22]|uniref:uncharacterized protein n=1 Tax=Fomitiporia mediterranea (strain MF3/22) TaxID=694068 RepID=UPI00044088BA|nr:uncharacterized protein FOMMEDRAFT_159176 [Fomitiporia mediterranea MF3/22]EJD00476.1 hypothetical protein FOMMEDRAFT_159176 [Fomitiporia mediterranea MF3/22]
MRIRGKFYARKRIRYARSTSRSSSPDDQSASSSAPLHPTPDHGFLYIGFFSLSFLACIYTTSVPNSASANAYAQQGSPQLTVHEEATIRFLSM